MSTKFMRITLLFLVMLVCISIFIYTYLHQKKESFKNEIPVLYVFRMNDMLETNNSSLPINKSFNTAFDMIKKPLFTLTDNYDNANIIFFETLNNIDGNMFKLKNRYPNNIKFIFGIKGTDALVSKSSFAYMMKNTKLIPKTFILNLNQDVFELQSTKNNNNDIFILKKNIQRQQGIYITDDIKNIFIKKNQDDEFVVAQVMLQEPFLIDNRKINMRIYLFVHIDKQNNQYWYIYDDGFLYYTPNSFEKHTIKSDHCITSGYIDRSVYEKNPMTIKEFLKYLSSQNYQECIYTNLKKMFHVVKELYEPIFYDNNKDIPGEKALIYGCDIAPDSNLNLKFMEINKGPDLNFKDERDKNVKLNLVFNVLKKLNIISKTFPANNNLILIN